MGIIKTPGHFSGSLIQNIQNPLHYPPSTLLEFVCLFRTLLTPWSSQSVWDCIPLMSVETCANYVEHQLRLKSAWMYIYIINICSIINNCEVMFDWNLDLLVGHISHICRCPVFILFSFKWTLTGIKINRKYPNNLEGRCLLHNTLCRVNVCISLSSTA